MQTRDKTRTPEDMFRAASSSTRRNTLIQTLGNTNFVSQNNSSNAVECSDVVNSYCYENFRILSDEDDSGSESKTSVSDKSSHFSGSFETTEASSPLIHGDGQFTTNSVIEMTLPSQINITDLREIEPGRLRIPARATFQVLTLQNEQSSAGGRSDSAESTAKEIKVAYHAPASQATDLTRNFHGDVQIPISPLVEMVNANDCVEFLSQKAHESLIALDDVLEDSRAGTSHNDWPDPLNAPYVADLADSSKRLVYASQYLEQESHDCVNVFQQRDMSTLWDKQRLEFTAKAILSVAFAHASDCDCFDCIDRAYNFCLCSEAAGMDLPKNRFKCFGIGNDLFKGSSQITDLSKHDYIGTDRAEYIPAPWSDPDEGRQRNILHYFNVSPPFTQYSTEELRLGDYSRGKIKVQHQFLAFRKLPAELRLMIYQLALEPRIVTMRYDRSISHTWSICAPPALLHVWRESRYAVSNSYQLSFGLGDSPPRILFNFSLDTLYIDFEHDKEPEPYLVDELVQSLKQDELEKVRSLAISNYVWDFWITIFEEDDAEYDEDPSEGLLPQVPVLPMFNNLKKFTLVDDQVSGLWMQKMWKDEDLPKETFAAEKVIWKPSVGSSSREDRENADYIDEIFERIAICRPDFSMPSLQFLSRAADYEAEAYRPCPAKEKVFLLRYFWKVKQRRRGRIT